MDDITDLLTDWQRRFKEEGKKFLLANAGHLNTPQYSRLLDFFGADGDPDALMGQSRVVHQTAESLERCGWKPAPYSGDMVNQPQHYSRFPYEPVKFIGDLGLNYMEANVVKYICRYPHKNGVEDLRKAARSLEMLAKFNDGDPEWSA